MASKSDVSDLPDKTELSRAHRAEAAETDVWPEGVTLGKPFGAPDTPARNRRLAVAGAIAIYGAVAFAITYPLFARGYLFAFDMSFGPTVHVPIEAFGLGSDFGRRLPVFIAFAGLAQIVSPAWIARVILFSIPLLGGLGMHRLAPARIEAARYLAGLLYAVNPFVYERLVAGHWHILLGYALLPWALPAILVWARDARPRSLLRSALWLGVIGVVSFAVATLAFAVAVAAALVLRRGRLRSRLIGAFAVLALFALTNATWIVAAAVRIGDMSKFTELDFRAFLVRGQSPWAATANVARLTGFFREDFRSPVVGSAAGAVLFGVIVALVTLGVIAAWRTLRLGPRTAPFLVGTGLIAMLMALGERAPVIGTSLGWLYPRIPGMQIFRESQKIVGLLVLVYAIFASLGAEAVLASSEAATRDAGDAGDRAAGRAGRLAMAVVLMAIPIAWTPGLFGAAGGRVIVSEFPSGWYEADTTLRDLGAGRALVLPWHVHMPFGFTNGRTNLNPAGDFFENELVQAGAIEFPGFTLPADDPVERYVHHALADGGGRDDFGAVVAPLGVDSILLLKEADWDKYAFLESQADLDKVLDTDSVAVYRVTSRLGSLRRLAPPDNLTQVVPPDPLVTGYLTTDVPGAGECIAAEGAVERETPYSYRIPSPGCWLIPEARSDGWSPRHLVGSADSQVALAVRTGSPTTVVYRPALTALAGHAITGLALLTIAGLLVEAKTRTRRRSRRGSTR